MSKVKFAPSLICMDMLHMGEQITVMNQRASYLHIDLMDLRFVRNIGLSPACVKAVASIAGKPVDCHIMCVDLEWWLPQLADAGADILTPHIEVTGQHTAGVLSQIGNLGCMAGLAISPKTPLQEITPYLPLVNKVTVMTVQPGFPGAQFLWPMVEKIRTLARMRQETGLDFEIEMDGSLDNDNFHQLREAGADVFVAGTAALFSRDSDLNRAFDKMEVVFGLSSET